MLGRGAAVAAVAAGVLASAYVSLVGPARTTDDYERKASSRLSDASLGSSEL
ncbi:MAG: hypothetical protein ACRDZU_06365 [Acidimicrobiales bacterium]